VDGTRRRPRPALQAYAARRDPLRPRGARARGGRERLRAGLWLLIREARRAEPATRSCRSLAEYGPARIAFCTDDREPEHIADDGPPERMVRGAVAAASRRRTRSCAARTGARWHGLRELGAVAPGYQADILLLPDLERFEPELVLKRGRRSTPAGAPRCPTGCATPSGSG
jgi:adenine deaminase